MYIKTLLALSLTTLLLYSCGSDSPSYRVHKVTVEPSTKIIQDNKDHDFSIVLDDMDIDKTGDLMTYKHKYVILKVMDDSLVVDSTDFMPVGQAYFAKHEKDLGMEIVSKHNGTMSTAASPVGYGWAIGNPEYGEWVPSDSTATADNTGNASTERRWRHRTPSLLFWYWMLRRPSTRGDYRGYTQARTQGKSYYGRTSTGTPRHGTTSPYQQKTRSKFYSRAGANSSAWGEHKTRKTSSSSRYRKGSSTRSRSGGFGK